MTSREKRWLTFLFLFSISVAMIDCYLLTRLYSTYLNYKNPYSYAPLGLNIPLQSDKIHPLARHVLIFVIDGLRYDILHRVNPGNISRLIREGTEFTNAQTFPFLSVSIPAICTIGTGANPWVYQVINNEYHGNVTTDNIFWVAKRNGKTTAAVGTQIIQQLFRNHLDYFLACDTILYSDEGAVNFTREYQPTLTLVFMSDTDHIAHKHGVLGAEYENAIWATDIQIGRIIRAYNITGILDSTIIIVAGGHGHADAGGHGGKEPEVLHVPLILWGPGIVKSNYKVDDIVYLDSIAPTISAVMGWEIPIDASGKILFDALTLNEGRVAMYKIHLAQIRLAQANATLFKTGLQEKYGFMLADAASLLKAAKEKYSTNLSEAVLKSEQSEAKSSSISSYMPFGAPLQDRVALEISTRSLLGSLAILTVVSTTFPILAKFRMIIKGWLIRKGGQIIAILFSTFLYYAIFLLLLHAAFPSAISISGLNWGFSPSYLYAPDYKRYDSLYEAATLNEHLTIIIATVVSLTLSGLTFVILLTFVSKRLATSKPEILVWTNLLLTSIMAVNLLFVSVFIVKYGGGIAWFMTDLSEGLMIGFLMVSNIFLILFSLIGVVCGLTALKFRQSF